jgi:8-oxo-dGTP diphosphatase
MRREYPKLPMVAVGAVVKEGNSIVLVKRTHEPGKGFWSIPGGLVELGEPVKDAVKREVREETGLEVEIDKLIDAIDNIVHDRSMRLKFHYVLIDFLAHPVAGELQDTSKVRWVKAGELSRYRTTKTAKKLLREIGFV